AAEAAGEGAVEAAGEGAPAAGAAAVTLGLSPPAVDCSPYARLAACVLHVSTRPAQADADGLSWASAFSAVQPALDRAPCGCAVWIAAGTYLPTMSLDLPGADPDPRNRSFVLWPGAQVLGGFAGTEADAAARTAGHDTVLSGDLGVAGTTDDNAYHVVVGADGAALDGLTVRGGEANGFLAAQTVGAGLLALGASMTLRGLAITDNDADSGGGVFCDGQSSPHIVGCTFARNTANDGGGLVVLGDSAVVERSLFEDGAGVFSGPAITQFARTLTVTDSRFLRNRGDSGGAVTASGGDATFERCWFEGNEAGSFGGAMLVRFGASVHVASSVFFANGSVGFGGALAVWTSALELQGATIVDNAAALGGAFLVKDGAQLGLADSVVWRSLDDEGLAFDLDGAPSAIDVRTSDLPLEVPAVLSFDADPRLGNVPLATRFAEQAGGVDHLPVAGAAAVFAAGDRIELAADGVERQVTAVSGDDVSFAPALAAAVPRFLRVDKWAPAASTLTVDLAPQAGSPLIDGASAAAPALDVNGQARDRAPDIGAIEAPSR
ncbi:MAG TPA: right-handed parallel beta-helix repeat-containing protein, partial [Polyangia bacterium]|nr:right-handed parallel beta-helix repeat-containing protein [Polyangia bacterium]